MWPIDLVSLQRLLLMTAKLPTTAFLIHLYGSKNPIYRLLPVQTRMKKLFVDLRKKR